MAIVTDLEMGLEPKDLAFSVEPHEELLEYLDELNFKNIKVNAVLLKGINDTHEDFEKFGNFIRK